LSDIVTVDKIFPIGHNSKHGTIQAFRSYKKLLELIKPTHIFTHKICDRHWKDKKRIAKEQGVKFILDTSKKLTSSGEIIRRLILKNKSSL